jgi:hypothetical protein
MRYGIIRDDAVALAGIGGVQTARGPLRPTHAERGFQAADALAHSLLADALALGRRREAGLANHVHEQQHVGGGDAGYGPHGYEFEKHHVGPGGLANCKRHQSTNIVIEGLSATEAHVTDDMLVFEVADAPFLMATGRYNRSVVVKTAQGWKFKRRTLDIDSGFFRLMARNQAAPQA